MKKVLRYGYTTGVCAAAATKAALIGILEGRVPEAVSVRLPIGRYLTLKVEDGRTLGEREAEASVIKDAGDDPDVTDGVKVIARVRLEEGEGVVFRAGEGVGIVTKPGLAVAVGEPAINPVPRKMIQNEVEQLLGNDSFKVVVTISIPGGEEIAKKTLNPRLGIVGGLSVLGTTGLVVPYSPEAWIATITSAMSVAKACGINEVVLCSGRTSERAHRRVFCLPKESYILMGDFVEHSLREAARFGFKKVQISSQWAKLLKVARALTTPASSKSPAGYTTHIRDGRITPEEALRILRRAGLSLRPRQKFNTAREVYEWLKNSHEESLREVLKGLSQMVKCYARRFLSKETEVSVFLVDYLGGIIEL